MRTMVIGAHPDDEVIGCGGKILSQKSAGDEVCWLLATTIKGLDGWPEEKISRRKEQIERVSHLFSFDKVYLLDWPAARLDTLPIQEMVQKVSSAVNEFQPEEILIPNLGDVHSDHRVLHNVAISCSKWFRFPFIKRIMAYEVLSETEIAPCNNDSFIPNVFIDISEFLERKLDALKIYDDEIQEFPFPRSIGAVDALAKFRGVSSGYKAAEAFELLRERIEIGR